ncbi:MAG: methyltransferase domain-containing protein [Methylococcaceae bacterium]|nr:methyltransferase domain-containing protein [Methylococcaceae bacterium]
MLLEESVRERYSNGAREREAALCCPVDYDRKLLELLPQEIIAKDYGCGDPSRYVREGDIVLDLGSGGGKICYMAAQLAGPQGRVIGVDMNDEMLALARKYQEEMAEKLGGDLVRFHKGYIQDLALNVDEMEHYLREHPVSDAASLTALKSWQALQRRDRPMIADQSVDLVISNCVLNLVSDDEKTQLVKEIFRVLKPGGRLAISDIVADEPVPGHLKKDPTLWSGCISGAFEEREFPRAFEAAGFGSVCLDRWDTEPWQVIEGIEFRAVTLVAFKAYGKECLDRGHAVIYRGPYIEVRDEEGHIFPRGERIAVCERTYRTLTEGPCRSHFIGITPKILAEPLAWCAPPGTRRPASETKGGRQIVDCGGGACC